MEERDETVQWKPSRSWICKWKFLEKKYNNVDDYTKLVD